MSEDHKTIGEMCGEFDVTPRTLRFYEAKELISPKRDGQKRLYDKRSKARLKLILQGKRFGFSLEEIRQLLDLYYLDDQQHTQMTRTYNKVIYTESLINFHDMPHNRHSANINHWLGFELGFF